MWLVKLVKPPVINCYRSDYFPRKFYYKKDAQKLIKEVEKNGGEAELEKTKNSLNVDNKKGEGKNNETV